MFDDVRHTETFKRLGFLCPFTHRVGTSVSAASLTVLSQHLLHLLYQVWGSKTSGTLAPRRIMAHAAVFALNIHLPVAFCVSVLQICDSISHVRCSVSLEMGRQWRWGAPGLQVCAEETWAWFVPATATSTHPWVLSLPFPHGARSSQLHLPTPLLQMRRRRQEKKVLLHSEPLIENVLGQRGVITAREGTSGSAVRSNQNDAADKNQLCFCSSAPFGKQSPSSSPPMVTNPSVVHSLHLFMTSLFALVLMPMLSFSINSSSLVFTPLTFL